MEAARVHRSG